MEDCLEAEKTNSHQLAGIKQPSYIAKPHFADRIHREYPEEKLITVIRIRQID